MQRFRSILITVCSALIALFLFRYMDYSNLSWEANSSNYIGILSMALVIISMAVSNRREQAQDD